MIAAPLDFDAVLCRYRQAKNLKFVSLEQLQITCRALARWYGMSPPVASIDCQTIDRYLQAEHTRGLAAKTINRRRGDILALVRFAHENWPTRIPIPPLKVVRFREPRRAPDAWTIEEAGRIIAAAGKYQNLPLWPATHWQALMLLLYDTAFRVSAALSIKTIDWQGEMVLARAEKQKTATDEWRQIHQQTIEAIKITFPPQRDLLFPWPYGKTTFWRHWQRIIALAGLPTGPREGPQKWRRTSASHLEAVCRGAAMSHLGHRTPGLAEKSYLDPRIVGRVNAASLIPRPTF